MTVSTIDSKMLEDRPSPTFANMIQGAAPGLTVTRTSGKVGTRIELEDSRCYLIYEW